MCVCVYSNVNITKESVRETKFFVFEYFCFLFFFVFVFIEKFLSSLNFESSFKFFSVEFTVEFSFS